MDFKKFKIWVDTAEQCTAVLRRLEEDGYVWRGGEKPTEWLPSRCYDVGFFATGEGEITYVGSRDYYVSHTYNEVTFDEYMKAVPVVDIPDFDELFTDMVAAYS